MSRVHPSIDIKADHSSLFEKFKHMFFKYSSMPNVRISNEGRDVLSNPVLSQNLMDAIINNKKELQNGGNVVVGERSHPDGVIKFIDHVEDVKCKK